jgi:tetratricopeptide (TPR) repeat protein
MRIPLLLAATLLALLITGCSSTQPAQSGRDNPTPGGDAPVTNQPINTETHFAAGQLAESQNNAPAAIGQYQEALKINPNHLGSLYRLAVVYAQIKKFPEAIEIWNRYVKATNGSATAYADLGFCQELAGDPDKATTAYQAGIAADPKCVPCRVNYGLMLARAGKVNEAVAQWQFVLTEAEIHYNLGSIYETQGRKEQAKLEFGRAIELDPKLTEAKDRMAALDVQ